MTAPVPDATVASPVLLLVHVPPPDVLLSVVVTPTQTVDAPVIAAGNGLTVTGVVMKHPVGNV